MAALVTYESQVEFARRWLKEGRVQKSGTWQHGRAFGDLWLGQMDPWAITFKTVGRVIVPGSFRVFIHKKG